MRVTLQHFPTLASTLSQTRYFTLGHVRFVSSIPCLPPSYPNISTPTLIPALFPSRPFYHPTLNYLHSSSGISFLPSFLPPHNRLLNRVLMIFSSCLPVPFLPLFDDCLHSFNLIRLLPPPETFLLFQQVSPSAAVSSPLPPHIHTVPRRNHLTL